MEKLPLEILAQWAWGKIIGNNKDMEITGICSDSRSIAPGEIFLPLVGEKFDGHDYIDNAIDNGATAYITAGPVSEENPDIPAIKVDNTLKAYHNIAKIYRKTLKGNVIAITGSNGKTTTKEMIAQLLSKKFNIVANEKNFNNEIGVPRTVMNINANTEILITELGMRGRRQIRELSEIVEPDVAVITNIGEAHFELLGSYQAIAEAKVEIFDGMNPLGTAILNADDRWYSYCSQHGPSSQVTFGIKNPADIQLLEKTSQGFDGYKLKVKIGNKHHKIKLKLLGEHNIYNALAAVAVAHVMGMSGNVIAQELGQVEPPDKRMEIIETRKGYHIINDTYNASPSSSRQALDILRELPSAGKKIAVLGDMLELGEIEKKSHQLVGVHLFEKGIKTLYTLGNLGREIAGGAIIAGMDQKDIHVFENRDELIAELKQEVKENDVVLIKGSRRMKMEEIAESLKNE
ncbi:MAG: UDP-N-acetylmuramoyl-tripeptide--D-alanyl-D-alanine ligase [Vulcanimicrobiota bacterium]